MTNDRDRLIELVDKAKEEYANDITDHTETDYIVECLLNNGVIVPPCKVGDKVYFIQDKKVYEGTVVLIRPFIHKDHTNFHGNIEYECEDPFYNDGRIMKHQISVVFKEFGSNTVAYFTKEEAERALKEREGK